MERRAFLQLLGIGIGMVSAAGQVKALPLVAKPESSVGPAEDMDRAPVEDVYYGHWRRVTRRHYRRVSRRVYRRRFY